MQVNGSIPFRAAQAYSLARPAPAGSAATPLPRSVSPSSMTNVSGPPVAAVRNDVNPHLIAGQVAGGVDFGGRVPVAGPSLSLYTRAADRVEAATAISIGRTLDLRG